MREGIGLSVVTARRDTEIVDIRALTSASARINAQLTVAEILEELCRQATRLSHAELAVATIPGDGDGKEQRARWPLDGVDEDETIRVGTRDPGGRTSVPGGWLAVPLLAREGRDLGAVQVSRPQAGSFSSHDEAVLESLAHMASVAIDKARVYELAAEQEVTRFREEILAGISHDMQTPLAAISGIVDILTDGPLDDAEQTSLHQTLRRQSRNLRTLVQQFLDFSRLESARELLIRPRSTDVVAVVDQAVELFDHDREIVVGAEIDLPAAMADPDRLQQVLVNLLSNALKYSDDAVRVVARRIEGTVAVDVVDQGRGISEPDLAGLFRKFHRGTNAVGTDGTGLGLYVSRALVEAQGGTLTASSHPGWGSRFRVALPVAGPGIGPS